MLRGGPGQRRRRYHRIPNQSTQKKTALPVLRIAAVTFLDGAEHAADPTAIPGRARQAVTG